MSFIPPQHDLLNQEAAFDPSKFDFAQAVRLYAPVLVGGQRRAVDPANVPATLTDRRVDRASASKRAARIGSPATVPIGELYRSRAEGISQQTDLPSHCDATQAMVCALPRKWI